MKKIFLSSAVILTFLFYAYHQRAEGSQSVAIVAPKKLTPEVTSSPSYEANSSPALAMPGSISTPTPTQTPNSPYKDGKFIGDSTDAFYGNIQVQITMTGGKITDVTFLDYPQDRNTSREINAQAMPLLKQEAIQTQNANVDIVTGATQSSLAFQKSLQSALNRAKI